MADFKPNQNPNTQYGKPGEKTQPGKQAQPDQQFQKGKEQPRTPGAMPERERNVPGAKPGAPSNPNPKR